MKNKERSDPSLSAFPNKHSHFQPFTGVFLPKTNTETNIYSYENSIEVTGAQISSPASKISGLGLSNRMSHLLSITGQETFGPKRISPQNVFTRIKASSFQESVCGSKEEWTLDKGNTSDFFLICPNVQQCP